MNGTISIDKTDQALLYEIANWIYMQSLKNDIMMHTKAQRVCEYLSRDELEIPKRYLSDLRQQFPAFWEQHPDKKELAIDLRKRLSEAINDRT